MYIFQVETAFKKAAHIWPDHQESPKFPIGQPAHHSKIDENAFTSLVCNLSKQNLLHPGAQQDFAKEGAWKWKKIVTSFWWRILGGIIWWRHQNYVII